MDPHSYLCDVLFNSLDEMKMNQFSAELSNSKRF